MLVWLMEPGGTIEYTSLLSPIVEIDAESVSHRPAEPVENEEFELRVTLRNRATCKATGPIDVVVRKDNQKLAMMSIEGGLGAAGTAGAAHELVFTGLELAPEGPHELEISAEGESLGSLGRLDTSHVVPIGDDDVLPPEILLIAGEGGGDNDGVIGSDEHVIIRWRISDAGSGVASVALTLDGEPVDGVPALPDALDFSVDLAAGELALGVHTVEIEATDKDDTPETSRRSAAFTVVAAEAIEVVGPGGASVADGATIDVGAIAGGTGRQVDFTIENRGGQALAIDDVTVSGPATIATAPASRVGPGQRSMLSLVLADPAGAGNATATVTIESSAGAVAFDVSWSTRRFLRGDASSDGYVDAGKGELAFGAILGLDGLTTGAGFSPSSVGPGTGLELARITVKVSRDGALETLKLKLSDAVSRPQWRNILTTGGGRRSIRGEDLQLVNGTVAVRDVTALLITRPAPIERVCAAAPGVEATYEVTASDDCDPTPVVALDPPSGSTFPPGEYTVTATATDSSGNSSQCTFQVIVVDDAPPVITCPGDIVVQCAGAGGAPVEFDRDVSATDLCDPAPEVVSDPPSGSVFPPEVTTVTCTAVDASGNEATCAFTVTVETDEKPPELTCPQDIRRVECTSSRGAPVSFTVGPGEDECSNSLAVSLSHRSGAVFPLGETTVVATATDDTRNETSCSFTIEVVDTTPPSLSCSQRQRRECRCSDGVAFDRAELVELVRVSDLCDAEPSLDFTPEPGTLLSPGLHEIIVEAVDASGNRATCSFEAAPGDLVTMTAKGRGGGSVPRIVDVVNAVGASVFEPGLLPQRGTASKVKGLPLRHVGRHTAVISAAESTSVVLKISVRPARPRKNVERGDLAVVPVPFPVTAGEPACRTAVAAIQLVGRNEQGLIEYVHVPTGMPLVYLPRATFTMGSPPGEEGRLRNEGPIHSVELGGFLIGKYEVTQDEWRSVMGSNPSTFLGRGDLPVDTVSWNDVQEFLARTGLELPSEAQWEHACRAGSRRPFAGATARLDDVGWYSANSGGSTHPVGEKAPNAFGLHDTHGNAWELCADVFDGGFYSSVAAFGPDPVSRRGSPLRVDRGGSWNSPPERCRAAFRGSVDPGIALPFFGFRVAARFP